MQAPEWTSSGQNIHQAGPWRQLAQVPPTIEELSTVAGCEELCELIAGVVEREALADLANVYSGQTLVETDKAGYLIRQWIASSLYDRIR